MAMNSLVPSHIQVTIVRARDLALKSKSVNSDIFAVVQVEKEKQVTQLLPRHSCPQWNQSFDIPLMSLDSSVDITIKQKTKFAEEFIGYTRVPFNHLSISRRVRQNWHKLGPRPGKTSSKPRGDILLSLSFLYKWDSVETSPISPSFEERDRRMLRRTKSEYKSGTGSGAGGNAKSERQIKSKGSIFGRAKNKKNQIFEDNDDFVALSIRSSSDPPTPPQSERRKQILLSSSSPERTEGDISNEARSSSPTHLLFTEATQQLEKTGIVDLWRADPVIRREAVKQKIRDNEASKLGSSSIPIVKKESSFDSSYEEDTSRHSASTLTNTPTRSNTITYRARSTPRRRERTNSSGNVLGSPKTSRERVTETPHASNTSLESNTSEYYSAGSSINNTPSTSNTMSFNGEATPTNTTPPREKEAVKKISRDSSNGGTATTPTMEPRSPQKRGKLKRGATLDSPSSYSTLPHRHSKVHINDHSFSTLQRSPTKDIERAKPRNPQQQYLTATGTNNIKRHSADIAQILKLGSLSQGRNDGLENVLNAGQLKQLLQKRNSRGNAETGADSPVSKTRNVSSTLPLAKSSNPVSPTGNKDISTSADTPKEVKKEALILDDETPSKPSLQNGRLLISDDDQETRGSTSDNSPQLLLKADVAISVDTATSSGSTTPSRMSPPLTSTDVTRETTPSPEGEDETDDSKEPRTETKKKHTVEYKKSFLDGGNNFQPFRPLPPSVAAISASNSSASSPSHYPQKKYSSTTDITTLLNQCKEIVSTGNSIELSSVHGSHSATNSGRASPVILEEEEEEEGEIKANTTPLTPTTPPVNVPTPNTVKSAPKTSASVSRRKTGGGLKRALSLYQENRKQMPSSSSPASKGKRTESTSSNKPPGMIRRNSSSDKSKRPEINKPSQKPTNLLLPPPPALTSLPKHVPSTSTAPSTVSAVGVMGSKTSLGASFTASKSNSNSATTKQNEATEKLAVATPNGLLSSHETHHSSSSSSSSSHAKTHTDPITTSNHFTLPPPPHSQEDAGHVDSVESVSGEGGVSSSSTDTPSMSSCSEHESSCTTSSSEWDEEETTTEEDYCEWSKEALISELVRAKSKLKRRTLELQDTKSYLEVLLVKVMNYNPELLLSDSS